MWTQVPSAPLVMTLTYGPRGQVTTLRVPDTWDIRVRNMARALATAWQLNIEEGMPMFRSDEVLKFIAAAQKTNATSKDQCQSSALQVTLHGDCATQYVDTGSVISKSVFHFKDCQQRRFRNYDGYGGFRCSSDQPLQAMSFGKLQ